MSGKRQMRLGDWIDNRYEVFDIRKGGMGVVFIVYDHEGEFGHRVLALKTLLDEFLLDARQVARFVTEIETWIKLDRHPNIVRAHSVQVIAGTPFVVLELVTGGDLRRWLGTSRLNLPQALRFGIQFCLGMEHALRKGLYCHRDIKPENLLITEGGTLKITDFGLAKVRDETFRDLYESGPIPVVGEEAPAQAGAWSDWTDQAVGGAAFDVTKSTVVDDPPPEEPPLDPWALAREELGIDATRDGMSASPDDGGDPLQPALTIDLTPATVDLTPATAGPTPATIDLASSGGGTTDRGVTQAGAILGTVTYMAPEQLRNAKDVNYLADLYSFGVVLYEMIATTPPFQGDTFAKLARQHANTIPPSLVPYIPRRYARFAKDIDKIVRHCLEKDPARRYASFAELRLALSRALWWVARGKVDSPTEVEHDAWELTSRGVALGTLGRHDEERASYEEAIRVKPDYVPAWFNLAAVLGALGRPRETIEYADLALHLNPTSVPALINRGLALHALNRPEEALACFDTAAHLQPRDPAIWSGRALVLLRQGNAQGARAALHQLHRLHPEGGAAFPTIGTPDPDSPGIGPSPPIPWIRRTEDTPADPPRKP